MALELQLKVVADTTQAVAGLRTVEASIAKVETAAKTSERPLADVARGLGVNAAQTDRLVTSTVKLEQSAKQLSGSTADLLYQQVKLGAGMSDNTHRLAAMDTQLKAVTASAGGFSTALIAGGGALVAFLAVGAIELKFLYDSSRLYLEKSGEMKKFSGAVDSIKESWQNMQIAVGAILVGNLGDITVWTRGAQSAIGFLGAKLVTVAAEIRMAFEIAGAAIHAVSRLLPAGPLAAPAAPGMFAGQPISPIAAPDFGAIEAQLNARRVQLDARGRGRSGTAAAPYQIPIAGGGLDINGIPMGAFGFPTQMGSYDQGVPDLNYNLLGGAPSGLGYEPRMMTGRPLAPGGAQSSATDRLARGVGFVQSGLMVAQGAMDVWHSTAGGSTASRMGGGAMAGMQAGMMFGPWGAAIGAGAGAVVGLVKGLAAGSKAHQDMKAANTQIAGIKTDLLSQFGSAENIVALGGGDLSKGWGGQNVAGLKAFSAEVDTFKAKANGAMNDMIRAALTAGTAIPAGMQPILESLIRQGQLTEANANLLMGLPEKGVPSFQQVSQAAAELGVNLDAIGDKVKNIKLTEQAESAALAFETLRDAGADMNAVFEQSAPKIQALVDQALQAGLVLPESIRPWMQQMIDAGLLVDETGAKLTDLSRFNFAEPLEASVDRLITKLDELIQTLSGGVAGAISDLDGKEATITVRRKVVDEEPTSDPNTPNVWTGGIVRPWGVQHFGRGGYVRGRGTDTVPAMLTPGEIVINAAQQKNVAGAIAKDRNVTITVPVILDNRILTEATARVLLAG